MCNIVYFALFRSMVVLVFVCTYWRNQCLPEKIMVLERGYFQGSYESVFKSTCPFFHGHAFSPGKGFCVFCGET